jgi:hypothetical protein
LSFIPVKLIEMSACISRREAYQIDGRRPVGGLVIESGLGAHEVADIGDVDTDLTDRVQA